MKRTQVLAVLALAFTLGIGVSFVSLSNDPSASATELIDSASPTNSLGIDESSVEAVPLGSSAVMTDTSNSNNPITLQSDDDSANSNSSVEVDTPELFSQAVLSSDITDIILTGDIVIPATQAYVNGILMYRSPNLPPLNINLNGHNITSEGRYGLHVLFGNYQLTGRGTISAQLIGLIVKGSYDSRFTNYTHLIVGSEITVSVPNGYSLLVDQTAKNGQLSPYAYGVKVEFNGIINAKQGPYINGDIQHSDNPAQITIGDTAVINATKVAIYAAGYAHWDIGAAQITGHTGVGVKAGVLNFNNTNITATGPFSTPTPQGGGMDSTGSVFQIEHHPSYADDDIIINVNGGTYTSVHADVFHEYGLTTQPTPTQNQADLNLASGTFSAIDGQIFGGDTIDMNIEITGGTYQGSDTGSFQANGYLVGDIQLDNNGTVIPKPIRQPSDSHSSSNSALPQITLSDGDVSVLGAFAQDTIVKARALSYDIAAFRGLQYRLYDITLQAGDQPVTLSAPAQVSINLPDGFDGNQTSIYYISDDGKLEKYPSAFIDGKMVFSTIHFSIYAIVEDGGRHSTVIPDGTIVPSTGTIRSTGIGSAASTVIPIAVIAGVAVGLYSRKLMRRRNRERFARPECEINPIEDIEFITETPSPAPECEKFIARPMTAADREEIRQSIFGQAAPTSS